LLKRVFDLRALSQKIDKLRELRPVLLPIALQQVMHEHPRFGVEDVHLVAFVVVRRLVINREQRAQGKELGVAEKQHVVVNQIAQQHAAILLRNIERAVVLRQAFVEPKWDRAAHGVVDQQVNVLMKDDAERLVA
jgi:hypothetical protein